MNAVSNTLNLSVMVSGGGGGEGVTVSPFLYG